MATKAIIFAMTLLLQTISPVAPKEIMILAGQSNMAGRGGVHNSLWNRLVPPESKPSPSILRLDSLGNWAPAHEPLHYDIDTNKTCGVGPGLSFANAVRLMGRKRRVIGLVPCAVGGTKIDEWRKGGELYMEMVRRVKMAVKDGGKVKALLWFQGESDTVDERDAQSYGLKMDKFIQDFRGDLQDHELLIIQVALASGEGEYIEKVRRGQLGIKLNNVKTVDAKGFGLTSDGLHLSTKAQARLGFKLALAYLGLDSSYTRFKTL